MLFCLAAHIGETDGLATTHLCGVGRLCTPYIDKVVHPQRDYLLSGILCNVLSDSVTVRYIDLFLVGFENLLGSEMDSVVLVPVSNRFTAANIFLFLVFIIGASTEQLVHAHRSIKRIHLVEFRQNSLGLREAALSRRRETNRLSSAMAVLWPWHASYYGSSNRVACSLPGSPTSVNRGRSHQMDSLPNREAWTKLEKIRNRKACVGAAIRCPQACIHKSLNKITFARVYNLP